MGMRVGLGFSIEAISLQQLTFLELIAEGAKPMLP
jgi:hypothetical protein